MRECAPSSESSSASNFQIQDCIFPRVGDLPNLCHGSNAERKAAEDRQCIGGLRRACFSTTRLPTLCQVMRLVKRALQVVLVKHPEVFQIVRCLRQGGEVSGLPETAISAARVALGNVLGTSDLQAGSLELPTPLRGGLIHSIARLGHDPDVVASTWLRDGAPIGIGCDIPTVGIFPETDVNDHRHDEDSWPTIEWTALHGFANYCSAVHNAERVDKTLQAERKLGFCKRYNDVAAAMRELQVDGLVLGRLAAVEKKVGDLLRIIHDLRRCGTNKHVRVPERVVLPRL